jgi:hypothetical protein
VTAIRQLADMVSVPAFAATASSMASIEVITALLPPALINWMVDSTFGPMEPKGNRGNY